MLDVLRILVLGCKHLLLIPINKTNNMKSIDIELADLVYQKQLLTIAFAAWKQVFVVCGGQR